jgi:hypothetical protein
MKTKALLLLSTLLSCLLCFSQNKLFESYYNEAKTLIWNLKTYKVVIVREDTSFAPLYNSERGQLKKYFPFLTHLSEVRTNPDLLIKIVIKDKDIYVDQTFLSATPYGDEYQIKWFYALQFLVQFDAGEKGNVAIPLCSFKHYERFPTGLPDGRRILPRNHIGVAVNENNIKWNDINYIVSSNQQYLEKYYEFNEEFTSALRSFVKNKCH